MGAGGREAPPVPRRPDRARRGGEANPCGRRFPAGSQFQHFLHTVNSGRLADNPARRAHRALRIDRPVARAVRQLEPLAGAGEDDMMVADRIAAAQRGETDIAPAPRTRNTAPPPPPAFAPPSPAPPPPTPPP